jgi:hypothetical protein
MPKLIVQYHVEDYEAWRKAFDANARARETATLGNCRIYRNTSDGNDLTMTHEVQDASKALAFMVSPELREVMKKAGVIGTPTVHLL